MRTRFAPRTPWIRTLVAVGLLLAAGSARAQTGQPGSPPMQQSSPQARMMEIQQTVAAAQEQAFEAHPELQAQRDELQDLVVEVMEENGFDPDSSMAMLDSLRIAAQDPETSAADRQQMMMAAQQAQQSLQQGQQVAMQDSTVIAAQEEFREDLMVAMREHEPELDALLEEFDQLQMQMRMQSQMPQGSPQAPGGGQ